MKAIFASSLLTLGLLVTGAAAQEDQWRTATPRPATPVAATSNPGPAVTLLKPQPLTAPQGSAIRQLNYNGDPALPAYVARGKAVESQPPQPLPPGPLTVGDTQPAPGSPAPPPTLQAPWTGPVPGPAQVPGSVQIPGPIQGYPPPAAVTSGPIPDGQPMPHMILGNEGAFAPGVPGECGGECCGPNGCGNSWLGGCLSCLSGGCLPGNSCQLPRFWADAEYLLWTVRGMSVPPLVTTAPSGVAPTLLNGPSVVGPGLLNQGVFGGGRFTAGFTLSCLPNVGFETTYFFLGQRASNFSFASDGSPGSINIGRPVLTTGGAQDAELVASTGTLAGSTNVVTTTRLWGAEENLKRRLLCGCDGWLDILGGFRYLDLRESLQINENLLTLVPNGPIPAGAQTLLYDNFSTVNQFYGGQLGLAGEYRFWKGFFVGGSFKLAMGMMHEEVSVKGNTTFIVPGFATATGTGGLLAEPSNIGSQSRDRFAVIPDLGIKVGYNFTPNIRAYVGYNFMYVSSVVRPGNQIDTTVNRSQQAVFLPPNVINPPLVGAARPQPMIQGTDFWAQGVSFGLEFKY